MKTTTHKVVGICRLLTQVGALLLTVTGSFALVRSMGLPTWAFVGLIIVAGMFFCGWVCPFGAVQEWLRLVGKGITGITLHIPARINRYLLLSRYVLFFLGGILVISALDSRRAFVTAVTGRSVELAAYCVLGSVLLLSLFMDRPFCKYLCGFGAISGLTSVLRVFTIKRDNGRCIGCEQCSNACQMGVEVAKLHTVRDPHCINCGKCIAACPVTHALQPVIALPNRDDATAVKRKYLPQQEDGTKKVA